MRRVVVTGMGLVTPLGSGVKASWGRLIESQSGIGAIESFDVSDMPCRIAGMVPDYTQAPEGCRFHPRCPHAKPECQSTPPWVKLGEGRGVRCVLFEGAERSTVHA